MGKIYTASPKGINASTAITAAFNPASLRKIGFERYPEGDFSDDGNRFREYIFDGELVMSYLKSQGQVYISFHPDELGLNYSEYSKVPTYKIADKYNGVPEDSVDLDDLHNIATKFLSELRDLRDNMPQVGSEDLEQYLADERNYNRKVYEMAYAEIQAHLPLIIKNWKEYSVKHIMDYALSLQRYAEHQVDIDQVSQTAARNWLEPENLARQEAKYAEPEQNFYYREIMERLAKLG